MFLSAFAREIYGTEVLGPYTLRNERPAKLFHFFSALSFLTIIPAPTTVSCADGRMALYFPLVGILVGGLLCGFDFFCGHFAGGETRAILDVLFLAFISGGIHLDGLADAADGLLAHRPKEKTLEIMRDPRTGAMGVLALIFCILMKYAAIRELEDGTRWIWLVAAPAFARTAQVAGLVFMDYARKNGGIADNLFQKNKYGLLLFTPLPLLVPFSMGALGGMKALLVFILVACIFFSFCRKKIGGMTGDTLGALSEAMEACLLVLGGV